MSDHATLVKEIVAAHLSNPNVKVDTSELEGIIDKVSKAVARAGENPHAAAPVLPVPQAEGATLGAVGSTTLRMSRTPRAGRLVSKSIWPGQPRELVERFEDLIQLNGIPRDSRGNPIPSKTLDRLMTPDRMKVLDPISGGYYSMLKHHLKSAYGLTHAELLVMYHLSAEQLPETAPQYSATKALAARNMGLGKRKRDSRAA